MLTEEQTDFLFRNVPIDELEKLLEKDGLSEAEIYHAVKSNIESFTGANFNVEKIADFLIATRHVCKINGALHTYRNGIYVEGEQTIHSEIIELDARAKSNARKEVITFLKDYKKTPVRELSPPELIPFKSRIYNLCTNEHIPYSPEYVFLNQFPCDFVDDTDEQAAAKVDSFLSSLTRGDEQIIRLIYETIGNCFFRENRYRGAVIFYGESGNNGKSSLLNLIRQTIGAENCSSLSLQDTAERFRVLGLYGKAANIGDDIPATALSDTSQFKKLVTGEPLTGEHKGADPVAFTSYAKLFFAANELPRSMDKSEALTSRLLIIPLNVDFSKRPDFDASLKSRKWSQTELEYVTRKAVQALHYLHDTGKFTQPDCMRETLAEYALENDSVKAFYQTLIINDYIGKPIADVYGLYREYASQSGLQPLNIHNFGRNFKKIANVEKYGDNVMVNGKRKTVAIYVTNRKSVTE